MRTIAVALLALLIAGCQSSGDKKTELKTEQDKISYAIGLNIGGNMVRDSLELDYPALLQGIKDAWIDTSKQLMKLAEVQKTMMAWQQGMQARQMERQHAAGEKNRLEGEKFLADNKKEEGIVTLPSGLQYKVIKEGNGPTPKATQTVVTHYVGSLINGHEFVNSYKQGQPGETPVNGFFPGLTEGLQLMKVGSKWRLFVPSNLAYGDQGAGESIPPGSALIFEIELLSIK